MQITSHYITRLPVSCRCIGICRRAEVVRRQMDVLARLATSARLDGIGRVAISRSGWCHSYVSLLRGEY